MKIIHCVLLMFGLSFTHSALADWSLNLGYHNPAGSTFGLNFLYLGSSWAFEFGIGRADLSSTEDSDSKDDDNGQTSMSMSGDVDAKYLFSSGSVRPFAQAGFGVGVGGTFGEDSDLGAGTGAGFAGLGILLGSRSVYGYLSANMSSSENTFLQAGLGFDI